jgi:Tfp pilus assembly protein PilX
MSSPVPPPAARGERGIVLVAAVLIVLLGSVLAFSFMATTVGERSLSSNVQVARGSLYSADAGVRAAQQELANLARVRVNDLALQYAGAGPMITRPDTLLPATLTLTSASPRFNALMSVAFADSDLADSAQVYDYAYTVTATGNLGPLGARRIESRGLLRVSASRGSFADFLMFTHIHTMANGSPIWFTSSGLFDGRMHTNGQFRFAYQPTFMDLISSANGKAWFYNKGKPVELAADNNGTVDVPSLLGGFDRGAPVINLPPNSYGQQNAALGYSPGSTTPPTNAQINQAIGNGGGSGTPPNGIYLPNSGGALTGGIYVQGNLDQCVVRIDSLGRQVYALRQGSTTRTMFVDRSANLTTIVSGGISQTYTGTPRGVLYTTGGIQDLRGPDRVNGQPSPALADGTQLLIAAAGDVVLQGDVTCHDYDYGQSVLGIYSSGGSVRVGTGAPNDMYLDAYVMATGAQGAFSVDSYGYGSPRGTFHLRGGMVATYYGAFYTFDANGVLRTGYARDFHYDRRGLIPPYYPTAPRLIPNQPSARTTSWKEM